MFLGEKSLDNVKFLQKYFEDKYPSIQQIKNIKICSHKMRLNIFNEDLSHFIDFYYCILLLQNLSFL